MDSPKPDLANYDDPIVAEVRRIREEIAAKCDYDSDRIAEYCRKEGRRIREQMAKEQQEHPLRVVSFNKKLDALLPEGPGLQPAEPSDSTASGG